MTTSSRKDSASSSTGIKLTETTPRRIIVAITGATGTIYGVRALQMLRQADVETYLVMSKWGARTLVHETPYSVEQMESMASHTCAQNDQGAKISSGSFRTSGMIVAPCSMRTLAAIANGLSDNLVHRAADVILRERRKLLLAVREAPLNEVHLENMLKLSRMGVVISPPVPAFYHRPQTIDEIVDQTVMRLLDQLGIHLDEAPRWDGVMKTGRKSKKDRKFQRSARVVPLRFLQTEVTRTSSSCPSMGRGEASRAPVETTSRCVSPEPRQLR